MPRRKVIISYVHFSTEELIALTWFILSKMTGNGDFTTPDPTLAEVKIDLEDLETKNTAAMEGGRTAHAQMMEARIKLLETLRSLGLYVEKIAKGNLSIMLGSGFPVSSVPHPKDRPDFWATYGTNSGDILLGCKTFPRAKAYVWQRFVGDAPPTNENQWIWFMVTTKAHTEISGLIMGGLVWFRCCTVTPDGMLRWKDAISIMVV